MPVLSLEEMGERPRHDAKPVEVPPHDPETHLWDPFQLKVVPRHNRPSTWTSVVQPAPSAA